MKRFSLVLLVGIILMGCKEVPQVEVETRELPDSVIVLENGLGQARLTTVIYDTITYPEFSLTSYNDVSGITTFTDKTVIIKTVRYLTKVEKDENHKIVKEGWVYEDEVGTIFNNCNEAKKAYFEYIDRTVFKEVNCK